MAVLALFAGNVALVVVFLLQFLLVGFLERIAAKNPKGFPFAHPFGHRSGNSNVVQRTRVSLQKASLSAVSSMKVSGRHHV